MPESPVPPAKRQPLLAGKDAAVESHPRSETLVTGAPRLQPREPAPARGIGWPALLTFSAVQCSLLAAAGWYLLQTPPPTPAPAQNATPAPATDTRALENDLADARTQLRALQTRLDERTRGEERLQGRLQEMADRMALLLQQNSLDDTGGDLRDTSRATEVAAMLPSVSPATRELILIKERNRLSNYADRAIATGSREALQSLVEAMLDPQMKHLIHAAQAEFKRVQAYYDMGIGIDPGYTLPVQELFKDVSLTREADLTPSQLHGLLADLKQPWEARLRAAFLLRSSNETDTTERLLKALREDPILDVAKQAQITFENRVGRKFRLFDIPAIEAWWQAQGKR
jgi:hypothetical protein